MKRLCLILAYLFLFSQTASAMPLLVGQKVVYRGTVTDLRISAVDGTAFIDNVSITSELQNAKLLSSGSVTAENLKLSAADGVAFVDFSAADVLTNNIGKYIVIKDSTGKEIKGWIKAAGTSETLGDESITGWTNRTETLAYETLTVNANGHDIDALINSSASGVAYTNAAAVLYGLSKIVITPTITTGDSPRLNEVNSSNGTVGVTIAIIPNGTYYYTFSKSASTRSLGLYNNNTNVNGSFAVSLKPVTAPSATGVTIVSTKGGTTYNWESKDASFTYNSAITYSIYDRDLTAYADGNHQIEIYDSSNRMLKGVLKAAGTGETLGDAANVNNCENYSSALYEVFTDATPTSFHAENTSAGTKRASTADEIVVAVGELWNVSATIETLSGLKPVFQFRRYPGGTYLGGAVTPAFNDGNNSWYTTTVVDDTGVVEIISTSTNSFNISNLAAKKVLAPSSSGATITTLKNGDVYNWSYKNSSFTYNASSYYVIIRAIR